MPNYEDISCCKPYASHILNILYVRMVLCINNQFMCCIFSSQYPMEKPYYQSIADTLLAVKSPKPERYVVGGEAAMPSPEILITGISILSLPLCDAHAKHLIE